MKTQKEPWRKKIYEIVTSKFKKICTTIVLNKI
jgi:hypothetical protein